MLINKVIILLLLLLRWAVVVVTDMVLSFSLINAAQRDASFFAHHTLDSKQPDTLETFSTC